MMKAKVLLRPVSLLVVLAMACQTAVTPGGQNTEGALVGAQEQKQESYQCESGKEWWSDKGTPKRGGAFIFATTTGPGSLENFQAVAGYPAAATIPQVYRHFVQTRSCYYEDMVMEPDMVKSWQVSPDGLTWTLKLRDDIKWHNKPPVNGRALTSADIAHTIEYQKRKTTLRSFWEGVTHEEPDAHTVILRLKEPDPDFLFGTLGERYLLIVPPEIEQQYGDYKTVAVGTGPYMQKELRPGILSVVERNPDWPEKGADGKNLPYIDQIHVIPFGDLSAQVAAMRAGLIDRNTTQGFNSIDANALKQSIPKIKAYTDTAACLWGLYFQLNKKPFDDVRVRKALQLAMNLDDIIGAYHGGAVPTGYVPSAIQQYGWPVEKVREKFKADPERAKQLLAEAGYKPGDLRFLMMTGTTFNEAIPGEVAAKQLENIGVRVTIRPGPLGSTSSMFTSDKEWELAWGGHSPCSFIPNRWMDNAVRTGGSYNISGMSDSQVDALSAAQARELDPAKRKQIIDQMQDRLFEIMPYVPQAHVIYFRFDSCRIKNMRPTEQHQNVTGIERAWLDETGC